MSSPPFPNTTNLGGMIASQCGDIQPWLIEVDVDGAERVFGYCDLRRLSAGVARALQARGLAPNARVGIIGLNSAEYVLTYFGIMQAGFCAVPIGSKLAQETVEYVLNDAHVELLYADIDWARRLAGKVSLLPLDDHEAWAAHLDLGPFEVVSVQANDPATILYTSGSTGVPKGVPLTHGGYIWTLGAASVNGGNFIHENAACVLTAAPLSHMNALFLTKIVTAYGGTLVLMRRFDARRFLETVARHRCDMVTAVPTMLALCARERDSIARLELEIGAKCRDGIGPRYRSTLRSSGFHVSQCDCSERLGNHRDRPRSFWSASARPDPAASSPWVSPTWRAGAPRRG